MVLDLHREALVLRIEGWAARHRPGLEDAAELETEIIVQARGVMLLDHEAQPVRCLHLFPAARLARLGEVTLGAIGGELLRGHAWCSPFAVRAPAGLRGRREPPSAYDRGLALRCLAGLAVARRVGLPWRRALVLPAADRRNCTTLPSLPPPFRAARRPLPPRLSRSASIRLTTLVGASGSSAAWTGFAPRARRFRRATSASS